MSTRGTILYRRAVGKVLVWIVCAWNFALVSVAQAPRSPVSAQAAAGKKLFAGSGQSACDAILGRNPDSSFDLSSG
jgi:hypothetical protein